jgi:hypothetical protein
MDQVFRRQQMAVPRGGGQYLWRRAPWWWWWWWWKILNDGALNDGALNDGVLHEGALNDGAFNDGALNDGALNDGGKKKEVNKMRNEHSSTSSPPGVFVLEISCTEKQLWPKTYQDFVQRMPLSFTRQAGQGVAGGNRVNRDKFKCC